MTPRAAIVGTGFMAVAHTEALRRLDIPVLGVVGSSLQRATEQAAASNLPLPYKSFDELLDDDRVHAVHICSPNHLHHEHALAALRAGKHVICEKPLGMDVAQALELRDAARHSGLVHAVCFLSRFYPLCQDARARVVTGATGPIRLISGSYLQDWLSADTDWNWRLDPALGGSLRVVGDIGSHWLDLVGYISGLRIESVMADLATSLPVRHRPRDAFTEPVPVTTEDIAGVLLRFESGARGVLTLSQVSPGRKNLLSVEVSGAQESLHWESECPEQMWVGARDAPNQLLTRTTGDYPSGHAQGYPDAFKALHRNVYRAITAGGPPSEPDYPTFEDGVEQALVADAIARSAHHGRWADVDRS
jgi:predicted dehydrogenase